jgi:hypothetical protein
MPRRARGSMRRMPALQLSRKQIATCLVILGMLTTGCVTRTVGVRIRHTAYVADGSSAEARECVDRCVAEARETPSTSDGGAVDEAQKRLARCANRCPGVAVVPETTCADATRAANTSCAERVESVKVREANPVGIAGVALGGVALIAFTILFVTGNVNTQ